jgi:glutamate N-acetyltransferase/amino-acid N-acetyltransferase
MKFEWIDHGSVTSPAGFRAGATYAGVKTYGPEPRLDLGILASDSDSVAAGVFTRSRVPGAPVTLTRERIARGAVRGLVANSGCSNVATGERGLRDAERMAELAAARIGAAPGAVLVASTGVIGRRLPMVRIEGALPRVEVTPDGGAAFARAIMTTDTVPKSRALRVRVGERVYTIGGAAKGSGMVHPDMATVLCFLTTDAPTEPAWLQATLRKLADESINMIDVDMDTSTSDMMLVLANGAAGGEPLRTGHPAATKFTKALREIAIAFARDLARDGEGARTLIEVRVEGARGRNDARRAARTIASSPLVKTMVTGRDPNPGRVLMALGRSGAALAPERIAVWIGEHCAFRDGAPTEVEHAVLKRAMDAPEVHLRADLGLGKARATAWGCDLTEDYVRINGSYTT